MSRSGKPRTNADGTLVQHIGMCEQLFSKMNFAKCKTRTQRNDAHLDGMIVHNVSGTCRVSITLDTKLLNIFHNYINISRCNNIFIV